VADSNSWSYLAGFVDGEGCFTLVGGATSFHAKLTIALRADDWRVLLMLQDATQLGTLRVSRLDQAPGTGASPMARWAVASIDECLSLCAGLRSVGGLRAKKSRDFELWAEAVELLAAHGGGKHSPAFPRLEAIKKALSALKAFNADLVVGLKERLGVSRDGAVTTSRPHGGRGSHEYWTSDLGTPARQWRGIAVRLLRRPVFMDIERRAADKRISCPRSTRTV